MGWLFWVWSFSCDVIFEAHDVICKQHLMKFKLISLFSFLKDFSTAYKSMKGKKSTTSLNISTISMKLTIRFHCPTPFLFRLWLVELIWRDFILIEVGENLKLEWIWIFCFFSKVLWRHLAAIPRWVRPDKSKYSIISSLFTGDLGTFSRYNSYFAPSNGKVSITFQWYWRLVACRQLQTSTTDREPEDFSEIRHIKIHQVGKIDGEWTQRRWSVWWRKSVRVVLQMRKSFFLPVLTIKKHLQRTNHAFVTCRTKTFDIFSMHPTNKFLKIEKKLKIWNFWLFILNKSFSSHFYDS